MFRKVVHPFYMNEEPNNSGSLIFDNMYKTAHHKFKFERDPKYSYFNAITRMKSKLSESKHEIYEKVFDPEVKEINKYSSELANVTWRARGITQQISSNKIYVRRLISFDPAHKRNNSEFYCSKPRLDDILAEYKKMPRQLQKTENSSSKTNQSDREKLRMLHLNILKKSEKKGARKNIRKIV